MRYILTLSLFLSVIFKLSAQQITLSGKITDDQNRPIPFVSVFVKNTTRGTSANGEGNYTLLLNPGTYEVQYRAVGFKQESRKLNINNNQTLNITLHTEAYQLNSVIIKAGGEDPAYAIIRKAIKKRKYYLNQVNAYTCEVYIKGLQKLLAAPKKFMGVDVQKIARENGLDSNRRGIIYLSESESKFSFMRPDKVHEEMISSKVSGRNQAFSYNRASDVKVDFYDNIQDWNGLSNRPLISPIAENALFYYNYKYVGFSTENGETINKIQVTPKRKYDACFQGYIYILEDSWRIYSLDLFITKKQNINFVDTIKVSQAYIPVNQKVWMPSSIKFEFTGGLLGFKIGGYFISIYKDYDINPIINKKEFNEVLKITKGINKKDSLFWQNERPVPLTEEEKTDYAKKEALAKKRESKTYLDSLDKINNKFNALKFLNGGYHYRNRFKHEFYNFDGLNGAIGFNTVAGFLLNYGASYSKRIDSSNNRFLTVGARIRYGFANKQLNGIAFTSIPAGPYTIGLSGGSDMVDLNSYAPMSALVNEFYSLWARENREKLYQKQFASAFITRRITGGLKASASVEWADRKWLPNSSSYSFLHPQNHQYTSNNPFSPNLDAPVFPENQSFKVVLRSTYDFSNQYETFPWGRRYIPSEYPTIGVSYTKGISGILGSDVDYDLLSADISKSNMNLGVLGRTSFYIGAGKFLNSNKLYFPDYAQFSGNQVLFAKNSINSFLLLNYYNYSTNTEYAEGHLEHNFSGFILNKIPLIRKLKLQEIVDVNYLTTPALKNYTELGIGVQYLGFRLMYGTSYNSGINAKQGVRIGLSF